MQLAAIPEQAICKAGALQSAVAATLHLQQQQSQE